jgi:hypothetical protein
MLAKMTDLDVVNATFAGETGIFEVYLRLLTSFARTATCYTLLLREYPTNMPSEVIGPNVCLRSCQWNGENAIQDFLDAANKREFVFSSPALTCTIRFFRSVDESIAHLMQQTTDILSEGAGFVPCERGKDEPEDLGFFFSNGLQTFKWSYWPRSHKNDRLEEVCRLWHDFFHTLDGQVGEVADDGCIVDYENSIWERLATYGSEDANPSV